jgi:vancomycin resistance protein YoaR
MKTNLNKLKTKFRFKYFKYLKKLSKNVFWFLTGAFLCFFLILGIFYFFYQEVNKNKIYPGVIVGNLDFGGKTKADVKNYFDQKNNSIGKSSFTITSDYGVATVSAKDINFGYNSELLSVQAYSIGRSDNFFSNISLMVQAYITGVRLDSTYSYSEEALTELIKPLEDKINKEPINAQFEFKDGRVTTFKTSSDGQKVDVKKLNKLIEEKTLAIVSSNNPQSITITLPIEIVPPEISTEKANNLGIKELIGEGHSQFHHSIPSRVFNVNLATSRINGVLIAPNEIFSFDKALGDVSAFTGYKQAYVIQNGHTVLGDGGGVCQVSSTFFRAILDAGLPIIERHAHAYRVGYYEQDSDPGLDATIFVPSVDLKFKNDTGHYILVQSEIDLDNYSLSFYFYGTKDGRISNVTKPVITSQTAPPPPLYTDDPNLPVGQIQQTDFEAWGANVYFTRTVTKNNKVIISDKFSSHYQPWQAVYLRGTKTQ